MYSHQARQSQLVVGKLACISKLVTGRGVGALSNGRNEVRLDHQWAKLLACGLIDAISSNAHMAYLRGRIGYTYYVGLKWTIRARRAHHHNAV